MNSVFEVLFNYGFHDTEITSINEKESEIVLDFNKGAYILDENGKETVLSRPFRLILNIDSRLDSFENALEIKEYGKKMKNIDYCDFKKMSEKEPFEISALYFDFFNNGLLFDGGFYAKKISVLIEEIIGVKMLDL